MFRHYSLRGITAAMRALDALIAQALERNIVVDGDNGREEAEKLAKARANMELPIELRGKRRKGMSAKSGYARWRGTAHRGQRFARATGPGSYAERDAQVRARLEAAP